RVLFRSENQLDEESEQELGEMLNGINDYVEKEKEELKSKAIEIINNQQEQKKQEEKPKEELKPIQEKTECQLISANPKRSNVLINEIAWMGGKSSANDEWIELKNISSSEINLKNWSLYDKDKQISVLIENDLNIPSQGFVLFERTDDNTIPSIKADKIYSGALSNTNESLYLFSPSCDLEDFVEANSSWPAGHAKDRLTMERGNDLTWHDYNGSGYMDIFGTPRQENSQEKKKEVKSETVIEKTSVQKNTSVTYTSGGGGGISYCSQSNLSQPLLSPIVINEIAWMGTEYSSSDEWIELKNISGQDVNLSGWQLLDKENQIKVIFNSEDIVLANGFYLLERTDETTVLNVLANKVYSGALSDSDESLRLFNSNCDLIDQIEASPNWVGGDKELKKTMERNPDLSGWHTYSLSSVDNPSGLFGTPKKENSIIQEINNEDNPEETPEETEEEPVIVTPSSLLITEISLGKEDSNEYVEIFNQTEGDINLCASEDNCYYLSYFANTLNDEGKPNHSWDNPSQNWRFPDGLIIAPNTYVLIDVFGNSGGDFKAGEYASQRLSNSSGSLSLFFNNPVYEGEEEKTQEENIAYAQSLKVDAIAWKTSDQESEVREGSSFIVNDENILGRKYHLGKYIDSNNNINDIEGQKPSIKTNPSFPPEAVSDLSVVSGSKKNSVVLSWTAPSDPDTSKEELDYEVYYSLNKEIDVNNLIKVDDYVDIEIKKQENNVSVSINDLYYNSNYYFAVKAKDKELNYSGVSNIVSQPILKAEHIKPYYYIDSGLKNKSFLAGPTYDNFQETSIFVKGKDSSDVNDEFSLPIIDENENVYTSGNIDGDRGVFVFDKEGNKKWAYECASGEKMSLSTDGTLYLFCDEKITALSPSGKLKWQESVLGAPRREPILDFNNRIYFILNDVNSSLVVIDDEGDKAEIDYKDLGERYDYFSNIVIDQDNNAYFFANDTLFKFNGTLKMGERAIDVVYNEEYTGEKDKTTKITDLSLSSNGVLIFNAQESKYDKEGKYHYVLYGLNKDNILSDFLWSIDDLYYGAIGINGDEFFVQNTPPGGYSWYHLYLYSFDVLTGTENWNKHWSCNGSPASLGSFVTS
ncbi:MAG: lamin tail domain-containing protein, partial [Candidatus Pacebacteria bacterium]|nr:lamin tail domain-containing protein [Candidatus Paceibacterota bacterium]